MEVVARDPRFVESLQSLLEIIQEAPGRAQLQGLVSGLLKLESFVKLEQLESLVSLAAAAGVPGDVPGKSRVPGDVPGKSPAGSWQAAELASARRLPKRLADRGLPFQVSFLMNDPLVAPPACLSKPASESPPRGGLGYADQRRIWGGILRGCGEVDLAAVQRWLQAEKAAREQQAVTAELEARLLAPPGLEVPQRESGRPGPPGLDLAHRPRGWRPCAADGVRLRGAPRSRGCQRPSPLLLRLPPVAAAVRVIRLVSSARGHPCLPAVGHARLFDCEVYFDEASHAGPAAVALSSEHHGGHPSWLKAAAESPGMLTALDVLESAIDSQDGPAPLEVLNLVCTSGRGLSVSVAILLGELLQRLDYAVLLQHGCLLRDGDPHEQVCESCRAQRPLPETSTRLLELWSELRERPEP